MLKISVDPGRCKLQRHRKCIPASTIHNDGSHPALPITEVVLWPREMFEHVHHFDIRTVALGLADCEDERDHCAVPTPIHPMSTCQTNDKEYQFECRPFGCTIDAYCNVFIILMGWSHMFNSLIKTVIIPKWYKSIFVSQIAFLQ